MAFSNILRPKLCQFLTLVNSPAILHRLYVPINYTVINFKVEHLQPLQTRGYRKRIDVSHLKPLNFDYSEDLVKQEPLQLSEIQFKYSHIPEINELPEHVKKQFTLEFASSREKQEHRNAVLLDKVTKLIGPGPCLEKEICFLTIKIRNMIPYIVGDRRNKKHKAHLIERIAKRKKTLKKLRALDYDRFLWLLKELKLTWTPEDPYRYWKPCRRSRIKQGVRQEMRKEKREKIEKVQADIEQEKEKFYEMKQKVLEEIDKEIKQYGLDKEKILREFKRRKEDIVKQEDEAQRKLNKLERTIKEMKEQKIRDRKIF
ncbi:small ribosomal subunit protein uS15m-like [Ruditapes philippinarum]|uniref:small ribosomal subunit protein uS15m-like n=1 Tax=Ruditapes philippinarum TaxID=129788 RepID=UPI00295B29AF|nr:small ribosomal subunit protein uS15m-like [Ruditapes philippinarum]